MDIWVSCSYVIERFPEWTNQPITLADFIGVAFVTALVTMARDIALIEPDPRDWGGWVMYFIDQLEEKAKQRRQRFDAVLRVIVNEIQDRTKGK